MQCALPPAKPAGKGGKAPRRAPSSSSSSSDSSEKVKLIEKSLLAFLRRQWPDKSKVVAKALARADFLETEEMKNLREKHLKPSVRSPLPLLRSRRRISGA